MAHACASNWPRNSDKLMAISSGHDTSGLRTNRHGMAAMANRSVVISSGENSSSAIRLATNASPQITATRTAIKTSAGFIFLALLSRAGLLGLSFSALFAGFGFSQEIGAVERRMVVGRYGLEAGIGQHALDHPGKGRVFVAHMGDDAFAVELVVLDGEIGPALDVAFQAVGQADEHDVAEIELRAGLQCTEDARQRHRLPEVGQ